MIKSCLLKTNLLRSNLSPFQNSALDSLNRLFEEHALIPHQVDQVKPVLAHQRPYIAIKVNHIDICLFEEGGEFQSKGVDHRFEKVNYPVAMDEWDMAKLEEHLISSIKGQLLDPDLQSSPFPAKFKLVIMAALLLASGTWAINLYGVVFHELRGDRNGLTLKISLSLALLIFTSTKWLVIDKLKK